jgi:predicted AlkP superfamily phosphohydrolase/phosphomutase/Flp pilus assembly protein TadD
VGCLFGVRRPGFLAILYAAAWLGACSSPAAPGRVLVLGFDGVDPQALDLLMSEGKLPNFARLRQDGAYGRLLSQKPLLSPVVWTTIATGKTPEQHGIGHFVAVNEKNGQQLPVTSQMRKVKSLWDILSDAGRQVGVVGWWATWPAETVNGVVVSDHACYHFLFEDGFVEKTDSTGRISPPELEPEIDALIRRPQSLRLEELTPFVDVSAEEFARPFDFQDDLSHFKWALATAQSYERIGLKLWRERKPDLMMVYFEATDSTSHLFGHLFRASGLAGELAEQQKRYGRTVEEMYRYADGILGRFLAELGPDATLIVLSDHGFELGALPEDPSKLRDMRRVSEKFHRIEGILYLYGNGVRPHSLLDRPSILDVAPTILALSGLPGARDMPGRVLLEGLELGPGERRIASYETGGPQDVSELQADSAVDPAILERLKSLGYLDASSPQGERNLAAVRFEEGQFEEAAEAYARLVQQNPEDGSLRASLAGALGALGRYDEALEQLEKAVQLEPLNSEAYHNRAVIYERKGQTEKAIAEYRQALRYNPQYQPSRDALTRLGASGGPMEPDTDAERLAAMLAERASLAARRGDYAEAMKQLDEAERIAPSYVLVHQYRSNVAFLMGDRTAAIDSLKRALELEPDNALFRTNLERLQEASPAPR